MVEKKKITYVSLLADENIHAEYERALVTIEQELGRHYPMFIGNRSVLSLEEFEVKSPIDSDIVIGYFQKGEEEDACSAITEAKRAFWSWSQIKWQDRLQIIRASADLLDREKFLLAALITYEVGKNRFEALAEVGEAIDLLRYYCNICEENNGFQIPMVSESSGARNVSMMKPYGTWVVISPFNFPIALPAGSASAAMLTGNTVVMKPTSEAPLSGLKLYRAFIDSGVPAGVVNIVTGPGEPFGDVVVAHPEVDGIAFTGSRKVGVWLQRNLATQQPYPKPVIAEMGSKNPTIITAKADLDKAVEGVVKAAFGYGGQKCSATSRVYVQSSVADEFTKKFRESVKALVLGDPRKQDVVLGPLIDQKALRTFNEAVAVSHSDGASIITGGKVLKGGLYSRGCYVVPTAVTGLPREHRLVHDELFVPFVIVDTFSSLDEALVEANNTEYGLTAGIFSEDASEVDLFFNTIQFGVCYANRQGGATTGAWPGVQPFSGWKGSGSTGRGVGGPYYLLSFVREQAQSRR